MRNILVHILNDPVSYINKDRFYYSEFLKMTVVDRISLNNLIFELYDLKYDQYTLSKKELFWISNWKVIKYIVYIIGCLALKNRLLWSGGVNKIPVWGYNAIKTLPIHINTLDYTENRIDDHEIFLQGFSFIRGYILELSECIQKRIYLLFPENINNCKSDVKIKPEILNMVSMYVKSSKFRRELHTTKRNSL